MGNNARRFARHAAFTVLLLLAPIVSYADVIHTFDAAYTLRADGTLHVVETIAYDFESGKGHGIYRDIPLSFTAENVEARGIQISNSAATDKAGTAYPIVESVENGILHIRIGDPQSFVSGTHTYVISYDVRGAVIALKDGDEIYWNVTGDNWKQTIEKASARVVLPSNAAVLSSACYEGPPGSHAACMSTPAGGGVDFKATRALAPGEGLTVAVAFPKGTAQIEDIAPGTFSDQVQNAILAPGYFIMSIFSQLFGSVPAIVFDIVAMLIALAGIAYAFRIWYAHGRDPRGKGTIIPYYEPPKNMSPMEAALILHQRIVGRDMTAELITLAQQGALRIEQDKEKLLGLFPTTDYRLIETGGQRILQASHDWDLYEAIFYGASETDGVRSIMLSDIDKQHFQRQLLNIKNTVEAAAVEKGWYDGAAKRYQTIAMLSGLGGFVLTVVLFALVMPGPATVLSAGMLIACIALLVASALMPRVTPQGALRREELLGFKEYLQIAEKDRLAFHNAPEKRPETFEAFLPFAIMFGVEKAWAKEFADMYLQPPQWYSSNAPFNAALFASSMHSFSGSFTTAIAVSSSGAGGGGAVGGGAGGGGGGGW